MKVSDVDHAAIKPFLKLSYPSFRLRSDGSYSILGLIDGQQFIVEGFFTGRTPKAGLYCAELARLKQFKPSTATPAPPKAHASYEPRKVNDVAVFQLSDDHDGNPNMKRLKERFKLAGGSEVLLTPHDTSMSDRHDDFPSIVVSPYGDVELNVKSEGASGDTYVLNEKIIRALPSHEFECSITAQDIMILESLEHGYYFLTTLQRIDPENEKLLSRAKLIERLAQEIIET